MNTQYIANIMQSHESDRVKAYAVYTELKPDAEAIASSQDLKAVARALRQLFRQVAVPVGDASWQGKCGSDKLCHMCKDWITAGCPTTTLTFNYDVDLSTLPAPEEREPSRRSASRAAVVDDGRPDPTPRATFGIELECMSPISRQELVEFLEGGGISVRNGGHWERTTGTDGCWCVKEDGSLYPSRTGQIPLEIVSPVLSGTQGMEAVSQVLMLLASLGAEVNGYCGTHVHIGLQGMTFAQKQNIAVNYTMVQDLVFHFFPRSRRDCTWCRRVNDFDRVRIAQATSTAGLSSVQPRHDDRYHALNLRSIEDHGTIEFRGHQGTLSPIKIKAWLQFLFALVNWSRSHVLDREPDAVDDVPWMTTMLKQYYRMVATRYDRATA